MPAVGLPAAPAALPPAGGGGGGNQGLKNGCAGAAGGLPALVGAAPAPGWVAVEGRPGAGKEPWASPPRIMFDICSIHRSDSGLDLIARMSQQMKQLECDDLHHLAEPFALEYLADLWAHGLQLRTRSDDLLQNSRIRHDTGHLLDELRVLEQALHLIRA